MEVPTKDTIYPELYFQLVNREVATRTTAPKGAFLELRAIGRWWQSVTKGTEAISPMDRQILGLVPPLSQMEDCGALISCQDQTVVGVIAVRAMKNSPTAELTHVYIEKASRRRGVGRRLYETMEQAMVEKYGIRYVIAELPARTAGFLGRLGFTTYDDQTPEGRLVRIIPTQTDITPIATRMIQIPEVIT